LGNNITQSKIYTTLLILKLTIILFIKAPLSDLFTTSKVGTIKVVDFQIEVF